MVKDYLKAGKAWVETYLKTVIASPNAEYAKLYEAMNYSLLMGGKAHSPDFDESRVGIFRWRCGQVSGHDLCYRAYPHLFLD